MRQWLNQEQFFVEKSSYLFPFEVVAKLPDPEKSMILSQFIEAAMRPEPHRGAHTQGSRAPRWGDKMAQKSDFAGPGSFATTSFVKLFLNLLNTSRL
jgi:hypothetical protein